ncbi:DUF3987 domain-containing protein [Desulfovibrio aerotolerans]|uniref:DUF3987 domain-containing protein n=1 Tax=Solidesulfovibrio aerotolerans TaxID=295255 RepID=A0A7C9IPF5_9BACT|nr:DUF3987 domain-containing protein [Solidesulfovibrio aerotolerans]MYL84059.1 DUF3987 domain-containing protein [Solidesulfovibrio aerotolerans]
MTTNQTVAQQQTAAEIAADFMKTLLPADIDIDIQYFAPVIKDYIEALMLETGCEKLSAVINTLSLMSAVLQKSLYIPKYATKGINHGYFQKLYPNLWVLEVNKSGQFKTTSQNNAFEIAYQIEDMALRARGALHTFADVLEKKYHPQAPFTLNDLAGVTLKDLPDQLVDYTEYLAEAAGIQGDVTFESTIIDIDKQYHSHLVINEHYQHQDFNCIPLHLYKRNIFLPTRATLEALLEILSVDGGGVIISSEFSTWLTALSGGTRGLQIRATLTALYDVPHQYTHSTKTDGTKHIIEPYISINGSLTYSSFKSLITEEDITSGFLARFLLFTPKPNEKRAPALPQGQNGQHIHDAKKAMLKYLLDSPDEISYRLTDESKQWFEDWHNQLEGLIEAYSKEKSDLIEPFFKRWSPYILKIAMLMQFSLNPSSDEIELKSLYNALRVVECAFKSTKWLIHEVVTKSKTERELESIMKYLADNGGTRTHNEICSSRRIKEANTKKYDALLAILKDAGRITIASKKPKKDSIITMVG